LKGLGTPEASVARLFGTFNTAAPAFAEQAQALRVSVAVSDLRRSAPEEPRS
jgi:hypothetical protein